MENVGDPKSMMHELVQGMELARQLQSYLHMPSSSSSQETRDLLIQKIISTFEKVLEMVNWKGPVPAGESSLQHPLGAAIRMSDSPLSSTSPRSEDSDRDLKDQDPNAFKKRNTLPRWTKHIRVTPGIGVEGPLDDGYSWRKYGQKDILGAMYPRGYYRCTHRNVQGCMATKQVQRADEDPSIFEITYRGKHTCTMANNVGSSSSIPTENQEPILNNTNPQHQQNILQSLEHQPDELLLSLRKGLRVQTENLDSPSQSSFIPFHFPLSTDINIQSQVFPSPMLENFTYPSHMSPDTSGISQSHFSVSPTGVNSFGGNPNINSDSQINHMIPAITSAPISSTVTSEFPFDQLEFDGQHFTFDNPPFFS